VSTVTLDRNEHEVIAAQRLHVERTTAIELLSETLGVSVDTAVRLLQLRLREDGHVVPLATRDFATAVHDVLDTLAHGQWMSSSAVTRELHADLPPEPRRMARKAVMRRLKFLLERGLVEFDKVPGDGGKVIVWRLTDPGHAAAEAR